MIILIFMVKCIFVINAVFVICYNDTSDLTECYNDNVRSRCNGDGGSCRVYCADGCIRINIENDNNFCVNNTITNPTRKIVYPGGLLETHKIHYTDYRYNLNGLGTRCPYSCIYDDIELKCKPYDDSRKDIICEPKKALQCPESCTYDIINKKCMPDTPDSICEFIEKYLMCPINCNYNPSVNKCISSNPNYVCELSLNLQCPINCKLNIRGDTCISPGGYACGLVPIPQCPVGCIYNSITKLCTISDINIGYNNNNLICEPYIYHTCPFNIFIDSTQPTYYPMRLSSNYTNSNIMCKYSDTYCYQKHYRLDPNRKETICTQFSGGITILGRYGFGEQLIQSKQDVCPRVHSTCCYRNY